MPTGARLALALGLAIIAPASAGLNACGSEHDGSAKGGLGNVVDAGPGDAPDALADVAPDSGFDAGDCMPVPGAQAYECLIANATLYQCQADVALPRGCWHAGGDVGPDAGNFACCP